MFKDKKVVVVMPAYNAAQTLRKTYDEVMEQGVVDLVIVVDDASHDETFAIAETLEHTIAYRHPENMGYGANQKTCYRLALEQGADIVVMVHPDYQYTPLLLPAMVSYDRPRPVSVRDWVTNPWRARGARGNAAVEVLLQPLPHACREHNACSQSSRNTTPAIARSPARYSRSCRWMPTRTISCSTTRCSRRSYGTGSP